MKDSVDRQVTGDFEALVKHIQSVGNALQQDARLVINRNVTTRAWLTGLYIVEYEQNGNDRAKYGTQLLQNLSKRLGGKSYSTTNLKYYRQFYMYYPELLPVIGAYLIERFGNLNGGVAFLPEQIQQALSAKLMPAQIGQSLTDELSGGEKQQSPTAKSSPIQIGQSLTDELGDGKVLVVQGISRDGFAMSLSDGGVKAVPQMVFNRLSFTHIVELLHVDDDLQRTFYAVETMRGPWSVRELQRQIDTKYFERSGWSKKPEMLAKRVSGKAEKRSFSEEIKSPFVFEFLGLAAKDAITELTLQDALRNRLRDFIMELGMGFCLEDEQKRLLIDNRYYKADLVFYHRILKCHVIIDLKGERLDYADVAQIQLYMSYYREHYMQPDDNPPVGLLLCTEYGQEMVEYLAPFTDPQLFVARYELELPSKEKIKEFLLRENTGK